MKMTRKMSVRGNFAVWAKKGELRGKRASPSLTSKEEFWMKGIPPVRRRSSHRRHYGEKKSLVEGALPVSLENLDVFFAVRERRARVEKNFKMITFFVKQSCRFCVEKGSKGTKRERVTRETKRNFHLEERLDSAQGKSHCHIY